MIVVHALGRNTVVVASAEGRIYLFMYMRTINNGATWTSFSDDLSYLTELKDKETKQYEQGN